MNNEEDLNIAHPDPAWDFYIEWHKLIKAKTQLEKVIEFISKVENFTEEAQDQLVNDVAKVINTLENL